VAPWVHRWKAGWFGEQSLKAQQHVIQHIVRANRICHRGEGVVRRGPAVSAAAAHELDPSVCEVPEDWAQSLEPPDIQDHFVGSEGEAITLDDEVLARDGECHAPAAPRAGDTIVIGHRDTEARLPP
jgi:hypothetical protein